MRLRFSKVLLFKFGTIYAIGLCDILSLCQRQKLFFSARRHQIIFNSNGLRGKHLRGDDIVSVSVFSLGSTMTIRCLAHARGHDVL